MNVYTLHIEDSRVCEVNIAAENEEQARARAKELYDRGELEASFEREVDLVCLLGVNDPLPGRPDFPACATACPGSAAPDEG